jgi:hypothetical protein
MTQKRTSVKMQSGQNNAEKGEGEGPGDDGGVQEGCRRWVVVAAVEAALR